MAVPGVAVPITLQTLGVMLAGAVLGRWRGAAAVLVFLLLPGTPGNNRFDAAVPHV